MELWDGLTRMFMLIHFNGAGEGIVPRLVVTAVNLTLLSVYISAVVWLVRLFT